MNDAYLKPIAANTNGIFECLEKGAEYIHWDESEKNMQNRPEMYGKVLAWRCFLTRQVYGRFLWRLQEPDFL